MASASAALMGATSSSRSSAPPAKVRKLEGAIERMRSVASRNREGLKATASDVIGTAEMQGAAFITGISVGYLGDEKTKVMGVDAPLAVGLAGVGYGLYGSFKGDKGACHALALGNGVLAGGIALAGARIGRKLAVEKAAGSAAKPSLAGTREVTLSGRQRRF